VEFLSWPDGKFANSQDKTSQIDLDVFSGVFFKVREVLLLGQI